MATVKYLLRSKLNKHVPIYLSFSMGRGATFKCKTGFSINPKDWSENKGFPKPNDEANKQLLQKLKDLEAFLLDQVNVAQSKGLPIDKNFVEKKIDECFNRIEISETTLVKHHVQYIIDNAKTRKVPGKNKIGLAPNTVKNYQTFLKIIQSYEEHIKKPMYFMDLDFSYVEAFKRWLLQTQKYSINHAGKSLSFLKFVALDAEKFGYPVHQYASKIETFSESDDDRYIVTLNPKELDAIKKVQLDREALENARRWFLFGCYIGQRVDDLMGLTMDNIRLLEAGTRVLDLKQGKGKKDVTVPVIEKAWEIVKEGFPYAISEQNFNDYIKEVAKLAGLTERIEGKKMIKELNRKVLGLYPKHELITSHSCRRTFATMYYKKIPTTILMGITGHVNESTFLKYINKQRDKDDNARLFLEYYNYKKTTMELD